MGLGDLPGWSFFSIARGVSADGQTVVGESRSTTFSEHEAFRWTFGGGMQGLGDLAGGDFTSHASAVSADGLAVVGTGTSASGSEAFRWTPSGGMQGLGILGGAVGVSADGQTVVGYSSSTSGNEAFLWTASSGMQGLGETTGGSFIQALGVSADGQVVVGYGSGAWGYGPVRWTADGGMQSLGMPLGGSASAVSADGLTVVGSAWFGSGVQAFRWTPDDGAQNLGVPLWTSVSTDVSADGQTVVGYGYLGAASGYEPFIWDAGHGMRSFEEVLQSDYGLNLSGWTLQVATGISDDGLTVVGYGYNPSGQTEAWLARLDAPPSMPLVVPTPVPTPGSAAGPTILDPSKPMVVITHGWQPTGFEGDVPWWHTMGDLIRDKGASIVEWAWSDAFTLDFYSALARVKSQGEQLGRSLLGLGEAALEHIQFIGHSLGTLVNAYAVEFLAKMGINVDQFTILDAPFRAPAPIDESIFQNTLPKDLVTWVENYYGNDFIVAFPYPIVIPLAFGDPFDEAQAYNQVIDGADHTEVHEWYQCTINASLCNGQPGGFDWSIASADPWSHPDPLWDPYPPGADPLEKVPAPFEGFLRHLVETKDAIETLTEGSPAYLWNPAFTMPADGRYLSFDFEWLNRGDGDFLTLQFDDQLLFSFEGDAFFGDEFINSGLIPIGQLAGQTGQLLFALNSVGDSNAKVSIRDLSFYSRTVPEPTTLALLVLGMIVLAYGRRNKNGVAH
jgi:probable HAF family extracellular repeat protein